MGKISKDEAFKYSRSGLDGLYYQLPEINGGTTIAFGHFTGEHGKRTIAEHSRIYYIIEGKAKFLINGNEFTASKADVVAIPSNGTYNFWPVDKYVDILLIMDLLDLDKLTK